MQYGAAWTIGSSYDANGNLTSDGSTSFTYDMENRLVAASGAKGANLRYDPLGRLYEVNGPFGLTRFIYDGDHVAAEYNSAGTVLRRYMWGPGADEPILWDEGSAVNCSGGKFLHPDRQGSVVAAADCAGALIGINKYDEYGIPQSGNTGRFQYTGQAWLPELGMYYYKARIYSPTLGRFLQTDPIGYGDGLNWYNYVGNDPVNFSDPSGMCKSGFYYRDANGDGKHNEGETITEFVVCGGGGGGSGGGAILGSSGGGAGGAGGGGTTAPNPKSEGGVMRDICHLAENVEAVGDFGVDAGLVVAAGGVAVSGGDPAFAVPGLAIAGVSGDVSAGSQLVADLTQARGVGDVARAGGRAAINALGGRVVTRALRGIRIGPYLDRVGQTGLNGAIGEGATKAAGFINWLDPKYGC